MFIMLFGFLAHIDFWNSWLSIVLALNVPDENYYRNAPSALNLIDTFF